MRTRGWPTVWIVLAGIAMSMLWIVAAPPVYADHYVYLAEGANQGEFNLGSSHTWVMKTWAIEGQTTRYCVGPDTQRQAIFDAIANWESQFGFPYDEFRDECGSAQRMDVLDNVGWSGYPCGAAVACVRIPSWFYDTARNGFYIDYARVWVNTRDYAFTYSGMRYTIAHEIGHIYGLNEAYLHNPWAACNPNIVSIMDGPLFSSGSTVSGGCDGNVVQSYDYSYAHWFHVMNLSSFQPQNLDSEKLALTAWRLSGMMPAQRSRAIACMFST